ncbi:unnamed protein product [Brugia timori]|uniref:Uncharacterized protein n=1 Tax=Brugia timori TaxID=42155 RepID=A0A0R3Q4D5_9BILA|nr:unnamed protein product [Brugia timori]
MMPQNHKFADLFFPRLLFSFSSPLLFLNLNSPRLPLILSLLWCIHCTVHHRLKY